MPHTCRISKLLYTSSQNSEQRQCAWVVQAVQNTEMERKLASEQQLQQKQARKAELRNAHLKQIRRKALNESTKVHEVLFINKLQKEDKELTLMQRMQVWLPASGFPLSIAAGDLLHRLYSGLKAAHAT